MKRNKPIHKARFPRKPQGKSSRNSDSDEEEIPDFPYEKASIFSQLQSQDPRQREFASSILMNISLEISSKQLNFLYTDAILKEIVRNLSENNPQILLNLLSAIKSLLEAEEQIYDKNKEKFCKNHENSENRNIPLEKSLKLVDFGLFASFEALLSQISSGLQEKSLLIDEVFKVNLRKILMKLISVMGFFCEILEENLLKVMISHVSSQILEICDFLNDEEIFIEFLNFFHITTEFSKETRLLLMKFPDENTAFFTKMKEIFIKPFNEPVNSSLFLAKAFILGIFFNFFQENACFSAEILKEMLFFTEFALNSKIIEEFANFEVFAKENGENGPLKLEAAMKTWRKRAKALQITLQFLNNLFEREEFEDFSEESEENEEFLEESPLEKNAEISISAEILVENSLKNMMKKEVFGYKGFEFIRLLSQQLLSKEKVLLFEKFELFGLEELNFEVSYANLLALQSLFLIFTEENGVSNEKKTEFLGFLWKKIYELAEIVKEIEDFEEIHEVFLLLLKNFACFYEKNHVFLIESGVLNSIFPKNELFTMGNFVKNAKNEDFHAIFLEFLAMRFPISLTNTKENMLNCEEIEALLGFLMKGIEDQRLMVIAQALNALFDVFADETYNENLKKRGVLEIIEGKITAFTGKLGKNRKFLKETAENLKAFIKYKRNLGV